MRRWFRLLVIALLLPAYSLAAVITPMALEREAPIHPLSLSEEPAPCAAEVAALIAELGDTTDDVSDHCLPHAMVIAAARPPAAPPSLGRRLAVDAPQAPLLRPPRPAHA